jgi:PAS domain S-box-containing protein
MKQLSILILEDNPLDAELIEAKLNREQIAAEFVRVENEEQFRSALATRSFDLILSDYALPRFSGLHALALVAELSPGTPFIFVSGALGEEVAIETLKCGATDYVLKHRLERLVPAIRRALAEVEAIRRREEAEAALRQSETRYRLLAESMPIFVWTQNPAGELTYINQQFCLYTGLSSNAVLRGEWRQAVHPEDLPHLERFIGTALQRGEPFEMEYRLLRARDSCYRWHLARVVPLFAPDGSASHISEWLGTAIDMETQKRAEEALRRSNEELQQFAFAASHDLQEPLRNVSTFTQLLARRYQDQLDEQAHEYIRYAVEGAKRMSKLIDDLLRYARIDTRDFLLERVNLNNILQSVLESMRTHISEVGAEITSDPLPEINANPMQMFQLLQNLLSNALKYRHPDRKPVIYLSVRYAPGEWIFALRDNGQGFDPAYAEQIFRIFQRLHGRDVPGTGIGLSLCKRIVERHGGRIWAQGRPGEGATFYFSLPDVLELASRT